MFYGMRDTYVMLITVGVELSADETYLFINPTEMYADPMAVSPALHDGPFLRSDLATAKTGNGNYEFSLTGRTCRGWIDWEQTHCIVIHINWKELLMTATLAAVGDGANGQKMQEQFKFKLEDASSLNGFATSALIPYLSYFVPIFHKLVNLSAAATVNTSTLVKTATHTV